MFGKKPASEFGSLDHFFKYIVAECEKNIQKYDIDKKRYTSIIFTPTANHYIISYVSEKNYVLLKAVNENGSPGNTLFAISYDGRKVSKDSSYGAVKGKDILKERIFEDMYTLTSSENVLPVFGQKYTKKESFTEIVLANKDKIQWRGLGCDSGYIGGRPAPDDPSMYFHKT